MDKKLLIIVVLLALYVMWIKPLNQQAQLVRYQLAAIDKSIAKEKFIAKQAKEIEKLYPQYMKISKQNKELLFPSDISASTALSSIQQYIKKASKRNKMQLVRINWGDEEDKDGYSVLPMSFTVKGYPSQLDAFLRDLFNFNKLLKFESASISAYSYKISFNAIIKCFKLKKVKK